MGDLPGWRQIFTDDFDRTELGPWWDAYHGQPAGDPASRWQADHVVLDGTALVLRADRPAGPGTQLITGGVSNWRIRQTYGKWEVRARVQPSDEVTYAFLLWPASGDWPPEIDFLEDWGSARTAASAFLHWRTPAGARGKRQFDVRADFTGWHTVGVEWLPGHVVFTLDGRPWAGYRGSEVPDVPMWLALQAQAGGCERRAASGAPPCPIAGSPPVADIEIDWVAVYAPADAPSR